MIFKVTSSLFLFFYIGTNAIANTNLGCDEINFNSNLPKTHIVGERLIISISHKVIADNHIDDDEESIQSFFSLALFNYFETKENWAYLRIKSYGAEFFSLNCRGNVSYLMQIPVKNIEIVKLDKSNKLKAGNYFEDFSFEQFGKNKLKKFK